MAVNERMVGKEQAETNTVLCPAQWHALGSTQSRQVELVIGHKQRAHCMAATNRVEEDPQRGRPLAEICLVPLLHTWEGYLGK